MRNVLRRTHPHYHQPQPLTPSLRPPSSMFVFGFSINNHLHPKPFIYLQFFRQVVLKQSYTPL
jgi:hypothetical protein